MIKTYKKAFTLAETLLTMIIIATFLLAITPVVIKTKSTPTEAPWKYVTLGDNSQNAAIYGAVDGSAVSVIGDKRVPIDTNISADKPEVFATKINPKISIVAKSRVYNPLISRHLIDFYEKDASIDDMFYNVGKISFDDYYNLAVGKNSLDNVVTSSTANFSNFSHNTDWTTLTDESDSNLKAALNTAVGQYAMGGDRKYLSNSPEYPTRNMSGGANTAVGAFAMRRNTTGDLNTAIGAYALESATDTNTGQGSKNIAVGYKTLRVNQTGNSNIAVGARALTSNTTGNSNIAVGENALISNTEGSDNIAMGADALALNTSGSNNIALGAGALAANVSGSNNIAIGYQALRLNEDTDENIAIGNYALANGEKNVAIGHQVLYTAGGSQNVAVGYQSLYSNESGANNTALGANSLRSLTQSENNFASGYGALQNHVQGGYNIAVGYNALADNITGVNNTAVGYNAAGSENSSYKLYISANRSFVGTSALIYGDDGGEDGNGERIMYFNVTNKQAYLSGTADGNKIITRAELEAYAAPLMALNDFNFQNNRIAYSDRRLKNIIGDNKSGLNEILQLKVKNFTFKNDANQEKRVGVIAQELQKVFPNSVFKGADGYLKIKQDEIFYACVNAIKELHSMIKSLFDKIAMLDKKITKIEKQNVLNEKKLSALKQQNKIINEELNALEKELSK